MLRVTVLCEGNPPNVSICWRYHGQCFGENIAGHSSPCRIYEHQWLCNNLSWCSFHVARLITLNSIPIFPKHSDLTLDFIFIMTGTKLPPDTIVLDVATQEIEIEYRTLWLCATRMNCLLVVYLPNQSRLPLFSHWRAELYRNNI